MSQPFLSLCMIVKNEEHFLPSFIERHRSFFDEWIIVDTGSEDKTPQIIQEQGFPRHSFTWTHHFAQARNHALDQCSGKWIVAMDADEFFTPEDQSTLKAQLASTSLEAIEVPIKNYIQEDEMSALSSHQLLEYTPPDGSFQTATSSERDYGYRLTHLLRLFQRESGIRWESPIHEVLHRSPPPREGHIEGVTLHHLGMLNQEGKSSQKNALYREISLNLLQEAEKTGSPKLLFEAARLLEDLPNKKRLLLQAHQSAPAEPAILKALINTYIELKAFSQALDACQQLVDLDPSQLSSHLALATLTSSVKGWEPAFLKLKQHFRAFRSQPMYHYTLAQLALQGHQYQEALSYSKRAYTLAPDSPVIQTLFSTLNKMKESPPPCTK